MSDGRRCASCSSSTTPATSGCSGARSSELARRGHSVHVAFLSGTAEERELLERAAADAGVTQGRAPQRATLDGWSSVAFLARALGDLGRYSRSALRGLARRCATGWPGRSRATSAARPASIRSRGASRCGARESSHATTDPALAERSIRSGARLESGIPPARRITEFVRTQSPDVVLVSPLIDLASPLLDYLKAARSLGIRTGIAVASWDNLTSKGLLRFVPERVFVWNEAQRREAIELHGIPAERVVATGAARFDDWFAQRPSTSREEFMRKVGLDPARPYLLYLCSSVFVAPEERPFVDRWLARAARAARRGRRDRPPAPEARRAVGRRRARPRTPSSGRAARASSTPRHAPASTTRSLTVPAWSVRTRAR